MVTCCTVPTYHTALFFRSPSAKVDKNFILTQSPIIRIKHACNDNQISEENFTKERNLKRQSVTIEGSSVEQVMSLQHNKKFARKVSSDYVKTIDQIEHRLESSIRSVEFSRRRPSMSVSEYQQRNIKHQEELKKQKSSLQAHKDGII